MSVKYQICTRCVMDTSDSQITFNSKGECNHCTDYRNVMDGSEVDQKANEEVLLRKIEEIKDRGIGKEYDCLIGLSGGVDSTYLAYLAINKFKLRPLALHLDNGWNSKLAVKNIKHIVRKLDLDLQTHVIDWEVFKQLQLAYLRASVPDIEVPTDHAIRASMYKTALDHDIEFVLRGFNQNTEGIMPKSWSFYKIDSKNLLDIFSQHGHGTLDTYPMISTKEIKEYETKHGISGFSPLNYLPFHKPTIKKLIQDELNWVDYGGKHFESIFTRFFNGYIRPRKFNIDLRRANYSNDICTGVMTRDEALEKLSLPIYPIEKQEEDYEYVIKKLGLTRDEFESILNAPPKSHFDYKTEMKSKIRKKLLDPRNPVYRFLKRRQGQ